MEHAFNVPRPVKGVANASVAVASAAFQPLPKPTGKPPFRLDLQTVVKKEEFDKIGQSKKLVFHCAGDLGGVNNAADQQLVADHMEMQFDAANPAADPSFFYSLGDVVYFTGQAKEYNAQFYEPYKFYTAPIFSIAGNHDGDIDPNEVPKPASLAAFMRLFCAAAPSLAPEATDTARTTMTQPNVFFTLVTPVANSIGLYTNVPEGGRVHADQKAWFVGELKNAQKSRASQALIVALHHPPYSQDAHHGASPAMQKLLDDSFKAAGVWPDLVLSGHNHNYQRFTRSVGAAQLPYVVAGNGGYWHLHNINTAGAKLATPVASIFPDVAFESYVEDRHGFLRITVDMGKKELLGEFFTVPRQQEAWKAPPVLFDTFTVDLQNNKLK